ncbi:hypothetical protein M408DRAFT_333547 [Serendipita vermifera MAFF 305830]|uniref:Uncharacterized protein n=1 Tax=Serendipita vermifera MAFF 305830 TaxID=933852 RepID=A0A0C2W492_SERVB|nr:hypothetical protein M408DRAFT_333547 [Serendipita vermifera MAFF 305830]
MLGVSTFSTTIAAAPPFSGTITIEPSPLSPVVASPQSNRTRGDQPQTPSIPYNHPSPAVGALPSASYSREELAAMEPMSPDVTLDLPTSQYLLMPDSTHTVDLVSPFGTTFADADNADASPAVNSPPEKEKGGAKLQYKPRRRVPTPKNQSSMSSSVSVIAAEPNAPGSFRLAGASPDAMVERTAASLSREQGRALESHGHGQMYWNEVDKGRRPSFGKWSFTNPESSIGKGVMKRLSRLRSNTDLKAEDARDLVKSAVEPPPLPGHGHRPAFSLQETADLRGYVSDGVHNGHGRRRSSGLIGTRLSKLLPLPFQGRRQSLQQQLQQQQQQHQRQQQASPSAAQAELDEEEADSQAHLWATALAHTSGSVPLTRRTTRLSNAGSSSADGGHRQSTITVRSSDGWFTTLPSSSISPTHAGNGSPISATFAGAGHDPSRQNSPVALNPSGTSLSPAPALLAHHTTSDPTTPTLATLAAAGVVSRTEGTASRRHSEHQPPISVAELLKSPPSQRSSATVGYTSTPRPQSLQQPTLPEGAASPSTEVQPAVVSKADLLNGIQHGPDSVRLLDVETAAAIRRSIDFEDRVRKGENVLRRALYGSESSSGATLSSTSFGSASGAAGARGRARTGAKVAMERSSSIGSGAGIYTPPLPPATPNSTHRSGSVDRAKAAIPNGLATGGGVFLPTSAAMARSPASRYINRNGSFHSGSSSGISTPFQGHDAGAAGNARNSGMRSTSGTLSRGSSTLREGYEETFGHGRDEKSGVPGFGFGDFGTDAMGKAGQQQQPPTLARRVGRRISRIFVGKGASSIV